MTKSYRKGASNGIAALALLLWVTGEAMSYVADPRYVIANIVQGIGFVLGYGGVGWLLVRRLPHNPIGWCFSVSALIIAATFVAHGWVGLALAGQVELDTLASACAVLDTYSWILALPFAVPLPLLLLPDGQLPSPRWKPVVWVVLSGCAFGTMGALILPGHIDNPLYRELLNPFGVTMLGSTPQILAGAGILSFFLGSVLGLVSLVRRIGGSRGAERQQLRWVALGGCCALVGIAFATASQDPGLRGVVGGIGSGVGIGAVPVCLGVAVLRYRLYDLGRVVSRTVSYATVTALLLGVYLGIVTVLVRVLPGGSSLAVAVSTLVSAALFQPLRRRVQMAVDHRFNRSRYDADLTLAAFTRRLRDEVDLDLVRSDLLFVVQDTLQPASVGLWLRDASTR